ncbi:ABC transporter substrate-binding protein [Staphylococcus kloosii]|uniref:Ferrichrome ABC transporter substrate-binding protein n=1 Tax=Staphylococcus kloosii TaxID=29384 RepID=A0A151A397_9STAP|nr:ABC transporter substrate-binding protein [Staphylococcus kloosii]KYH13793.1 ferrichrome ABC transporter substrate-binding protein [Staphylococcus kloosii]
MKKILVLLLSMFVILAACGNKDSNDSKTSDKSSHNKETKTFTQNDGKKVKIPKDPKRIFVLHPTYIGALVKFDHKPVGVIDFVKQNKTLDQATKGVKRVGQTDIEQIAQTKPDLIITSKEDKNIKKLKKIAPTVQFDSKKSNYKETTIQLGEIVNEKSKAKKWVKHWDQQMAQDKEKLGNKIKGKTITAVQSTPKGLVAFGKSLGRGTEIVYDGYDMKMPKALEDKVHSSYNAQISQEELATYTGDYIILATNGDKPAFTKTDNWRNLNAVKKGHVITLDASDTTYNDPISLEKQRKIILKQLNTMN